MDWNKYEEETTKRTALYCLSGLFALLIVVLAVVGVSSIRNGFFARPLTYEVERVIDGDTFVLVGGEHIRLYGVDCPEVNEPGFWPAKVFATNALLNHRVGLERKYKDRYGRTVAMVWLYTEHSIEMRMSLSELLLITGNAVIADKYCTDPICDEWHKDYKREN